MGRIAEVLVIGEGTAIDIAPAGAGDSGGAKEHAAVVDPNGFTGGQGRGEGAADRQGGVVGGAAWGDGAVGNADVVGNGANCRGGCRSR